MMEGVDTAGIALSATSPAPSPIRGFVFVDLRGHGLYLASRGPDAGDELRRRYREIVRGTIAHYRALAVTEEGDGVYAVLADPTIAVRCARSILRRTVAPRDAGEPLAVGVGVHAAPVDDDDLSVLRGPGNLAARLAAIAKPGEILATAALARDGTPSGVRFIARPPVPLRGVATPIDVVEVVAIDRPRRDGAARIARLAFAVTLAGTLALGVATGIADAPILPTDGSAGVGPVATGPTTVGGTAGDGSSATGPAGDGSSATGPAIGPDGGPVDGGIDGTSLEGDDGVALQAGGPPPTYRSGPGGARFR